MRLPAVLAAITAGLLPLSEVPAQSLNLRVIAGNESNNRLLEVDFVNETTAVLNTDAETRAGISGLDFRVDLGTSGDPALNLLVTDPPRGEILIYRDLGPTGEIVYQRSAEPGPRKPHAPSQDFAANLYVIESSPGTSLESRVWVFPRANGDYGAPVLLDDDFGGRTVRVLADTRVSPGAFGEPTRPDRLGIDDLVVLSEDPAMMLVYRAAAIQTALATAAQIDPDVLIHPSDAPGSVLRFPDGAQPSGFDFVDENASMLISTNGGDILAFGWRSGSPATLQQLPDFQTGLGNGKLGIRVGRAGDTSQAFVANRNMGSIVQFDIDASSGDPAGTLLTVVANGVEHPEGLAITNSNLAAASTCVGQGCNLLGLINHIFVVQGTISGTILEDVCVATDPRVAAGTCNGDPLLLGSVCPGFVDMGDVTIPGTMCGTPEMAFVVTASTDPIDNGFVDNEAFEDVVLADAPECPEAILGWATIPGVEVPIPEGQMIEITSGCGSSRGITRENSIWGIGMILNLSALPGATDVEKLTNFTGEKFANLELTLDLAAGLISKKVRNKLRRCISSAERQFDRARYANAQAEIAECQLLVELNPGAFTSGPPNPNPGGDILGRLANIDFTIEKIMLLP